MSYKIRFGDFVKEASVDHQEISYDLLIPQVQFDEHGKEIPYKPAKLELRVMDVYRLLSPYISVRLFEQIKAVVPLAVYLILFQLLILNQAISDSWIITAGLLSVIVGLMLFMEGLKLGLMPFGEALGYSLPRKSPLWLVLLITFVLGISVTFAEPAIGALQTAGSIVNISKAPYLYALLNMYTWPLTLAVGMGVGLAAILGTLRFLYRWSLKPLIYCTLVPMLGLTVYFLLNPALSKVVGLAWDCGAVTTGPVTVPLVLALGIGVANMAGRGSSPLSGFGIVTLASLFPVMGVMCLSIYVAHTVTPEMIMESAKAAVSQASQAPVVWYKHSPFVETFTGVRAIVPLVLFLFFIMKGVLKEKIEHSGIIAYGIVLAVLGMIIFNLGLTYGLTKLGSLSGELVPAAFTTIAAGKESPLYLYSLGLFIAISFAWFLGFGATLAEPALNALGITVENLTNGAFRKSLLMYSVSFGVAFGIAIGIIKIIFSIPIAYFLVPGYIAGMILTVFSSEEFVNVAWDSAGVTTGPVTVPLVLAMGLGLSNAVGAVEGFGILSMASICPILSVLACGLWIRMLSKLESMAEKPEKVEVTAL
jgi:hypothetical protein